MYTFAIERKRPPMLVHFNSFQPIEQYCGHRSHEPIRMWWTTRHIYNRSRYSCICEYLPDAGT